MVLRRRRLRRFFSPGVLLVTACLILIASRFWPSLAAWENAFLHGVSRPVLSLFTGVSRAFENGFDRLRGLLVLSSENAKLKEEVLNLREKVMELEPERAEAMRLRELLGFMEREPDALIGARILAYDPAPGSQSIWIDRGSDAGVARGQGVISPEGVVGVVAKTTPQDAAVLLLTDPRSAVAGETKAKGVRGLVRGKEKSLGFDRRIWLTRMEYMEQHSELNPSDEVVTSGLDRVFPPGLPIGLLRSVERDESGFFLTAEILPAVDFARLREVVVLRKP